MHQTVGSIVDPAERNNVIGFKPTRGLIATDGMIPISSRQDVIGTLTRSVRDAAYLLTCMAGRSVRDERTSKTPFQWPTNFVECCEKTDLSDIRIGVPRNGFASNIRPHVMDKFAQAIALLRLSGATVLDDTDFPAAAEFKELNQQVKGIVRSSEFKRDIARYLKSLHTNPNNIHSTEDIIDFTMRKEIREDYPARDIGKFLWTQAEGVEVGSEKYERLVKQELYFGGEGGITGTLKQFDVEVLMVPTTGGIANDLAAKMGFPVIAIPLGFLPEGTPISKTGDLVTAAPGMP